MYTNIEERACDLAEDLTERLKTVSPALYHQVHELLDINKAERHIRGGMATRRKYKGENA